MSNADAIVRAMAKDYGDDGPCLENRNGEKECGLCGGREAAQETGRQRWKVEHDDDCPWLLARASVDNASLDGPSEPMTSGRCYGCGHERIATVTERGVSFTCWHAGTRETVPEPCDDCTQWLALGSQPRPFAHSGIGLLPHTAEEK